jgi:hypothetical protein
MTQNCFGWPQVMLILLNIMVLPGTDTYWSLNLVKVASWTCQEFLNAVFDKRGHAVALLVETLRYKLEGCGFDSQWCHGIFPLT